MSDHLDIFFATTLFTWLVNLAFTLFLNERIHLRFPAILSKKLNVWQVCVLQNLVVSVFVGASVGITFAINAGFYLELLITGLLSGVAYALTYELFDYKTTCGCSKFRQLTKHQRLTLIKRENGEVVFMARVLFEEIDGNRAQVQIKKIIKDKIQGHLKFFQDETMYVTIFELFYV